MPDGGKLTIEASNTILDDDYADRNAEVKPGHYVMLAVTDTGTGMSPEVAGAGLRALLHYQAHGQGTGLGLSMIYGFAKQSGGHLKIYSEAGHGTTVKLYLPKLRAATARARPTSPPIHRSRQAHGEAILIVEDERGALARGRPARRSRLPHVRGAGRCCGHRSILAASGPIDLLLSDVVLPGGTSGVQFAREAQARYPALRVLYMSGYTRNAIIHNGVVDPGVNLLTKPFRKQEIAVAVRDCLDRGRKT